VSSEPRSACVVLVSPRNPLNIGAAARAISNFGFTELRLVNAYRVAVDEARSAKGAGAILENATEFTDIGSAIADCSLIVGTSSVARRDLQLPLRRLEPAARMIKSHAGRVALLFGSEKFGLSNDDLSFCHWLLRIPTREEHGSMNLGQSVAVCLYELIRSGSRTAQKAPENARAADAGDIDRFTNYIFEALELSGYLNPVTAESMTQKVRRLVRRMNLSSHDAVQWQGMLRQIVWKLKQE
jgi:TrmH family RNA methyltransferase